MSNESLTPQPPPPPPRKGRHWVEPSDKSKPKWVVPPAEVPSLPPCPECGQPFKLDAAKGVSGGVVIVFDSDKSGKPVKRYYHGYDVPGSDHCYSRAERKGFP